MLHSLIGWLDAERWRFWFVGLAATLWWAFTVLRGFSRSTAPSSPGSRRLDWLLWLFASVVLLLAWRWPYLVGPAILNPDEAQIIAGAITLKSHPVFWKYVDGTTHGPLTDLPLLIAHACGWPLDYSGARFVGGVLILGGFAFAARGLTLLYSAPAVRLGLAPVMFFWASVAYYDFAGYTSEQASIALLLAAVWPLLAGIVSVESSLRRRCGLLALGGFLLGCVPYAKLQGVPPGLALGLLTLFALARQHPSPPRSRWLLATACIGGALLPSLALGLYLWIFGLGGHFWASYVLNNLLYARAPGLSWSTTLSLLWKFMDAAPGFQWVVLTFGGLTAAAVLSVSWPQPIPRRWPWLLPSRPSLRECCTPVWRGFSPPGRAIMGALVLLALTSLYAAIGRHQLYGHYLQYVAIPVGLGSAIFCGELWSRVAPRFRQLATAVPALLVAIVPLMFIRADRSDPEMLGLWTRHHGEWRQPASLAIARLANPGDSMTVWGWMPAFHVETQLPHATREANTYRQIEPGPMQSYYRQRFLSDFTRHRPRVFVDAVGGNNFSYGEDRRDCAHESFPELQALIERDYVLVREVNGARIYLRKPSTGTAVLSGTP